MRTSSCCQFSGWFGGGAACLPAGEVCPSLTLINQVTHQHQTVIEGGTLYETRSASSRRPDF